MLILRCREWWSIRPMNNCITIVISSRYIIRVWVWLHYYWSFIYSCRSLIICTLSYCLHLHFQRWRLGFQYSPNWCHRFFLWVDGYRLAFNVKQFADTFEEYHYFVIRFALCGDYSLPFLLIVLVWHLGSGPSFFSALRKPLNRNWSYRGGTPCSVLTKKTSLQKFEQYFWQICNTRKHPQPHSN